MILSNQTLALVGATGAIGGAFLRVARREGARCITLGRRAAADDVAHFDADIDDPTALRAAVDAMFAASGRIDTLVNLAGTHHKPMDLVRDDPAHLLAEFERVLRTNLTGAFALTAAVAPHLVAQRHGHLIHLCSNASRMALYGSYGYNASKHGLEGLVKTAAAQLAPFGVRVNGVAPGTVETDLNRMLLRDPDGRFSARAAAILAHTPSKRFASLDGIAETLVALCLPQRHLTGNVVFCDDGYNIEGHSWPAGTQAVYEGADAIDRLYRRLDEDYPRRD